jgi:hypothetical protein
MTTLPFDYSSLDSVFMSFSNELLNNVAQDDAHDFEDFFLDEDTPTNLADDLLDVLYRQVEILLENSSTDHQATRLPSIMRKLFYVCETDSSNGSPRLRNQAKMERAFQETVLRGDTVVKIIVRCDLFYSHPDYHGNDHDMIYTTHTKLQSVTIPAPVPVGVTSMPVNLSAAITQPAPVPTNEFRHKLLPSDVKQRYGDHQDPNIIVPVSQLVEFIPAPDCKLHRKHFYQPSIAGEKVIVRNGSVLSSIYNPKEFHQNLPNCHDVTFPGIHMWYKLFSGHGNAHIICIVPHELLEQGHGGGQGFEFDEDLPPHKSGYLFNWHNDILRALQDSTMFPPDSIPAHRVKSIHNGYQAILAILHDSHPAFVAHPVSLCKNWPEQKTGQSIFAFHAEFTEFISLCAIFMDGTLDLNSPTVMDTFMQNCTHSAYLHCYSSTRFP